MIQHSVLSRKLFMVALICTLKFGIRNSAVWAAGVLPPQETQPATPATSSQPSYLTIGQTLPADVAVLDENGKERTLTSYLNYADGAVIGFYSARCATHPTAWPLLKKLYAQYHEWPVRFIGVAARPEESIAEVQKAMQSAGLSYPIVKDKEGRLAKLMNIKGTPEIVILDQWRTLRYRGPVTLASPKIPRKADRQETLENRLLAAPEGGAFEALRAVLSYDPVDLPEPETALHCPLLE